MIDKLLSRVERVTESGCWIYTGELNRNGYGTIRAAGKRKMAHRLLFEHFVGPIQHGYVLDHLCRVRCCCNPHHMEPVTVKENTLRGLAELFKQEIE